MRVMKRWLALGMAAVMAVGSMSGCGKKQESVSLESSAMGQDKVTITYWVSLNPVLAQVANSYDDLLYFQELEKRLDVDFEFIHPPVGQELEQFQLMLASGKLPDIIDFAWLDKYPGGPEKAIEDKIIVPINDYMDRVPNFKAVFESDEFNTKEGTTDSGNIFGFYTFPVKDSKLKTMLSLMFRKDWLDDLGLEYPETIADWENMMVAFKEQKGVEYPLVIKFEDIKGSNNFNSAFRVGNAFYLDEEGKVQYGPAQEKYKEYLILLNKWYQMEILNPDFASMDGIYVNSLVLKNKAGVMLGWIGGDLGSWMKAATDEGFKVEGTVNPVMEKGEEPFLAAGYQNSISGTVACITPKAIENENKLDAILKYMDYLYTDEGLMLKTYGIEGTTFEMVSGKPIYKDIITNNSEGLNMAQALAKYTQASVNGPGFGLVPGYVEQYYQYDEQLSTMKRVNSVADIVKKHTYPGATVTAEEADELASIMRDVETVKDEEMIAFIMGVRPIDEYGDFISELKKLGIDRAIEIKQNALDRFNSR